MGEDDLVFTEKRMVYFFSTRLLAAYIIYTMVFCLTLGYGT